MMEERLIDGTLLAEYIRKIDMPFEKKTTVLCVLNTMPTIDPVKHGKWIISSDGYYPYCSECNFRPEGKMTNYCPNCGARMDGKDGE